MVVRIVDIFYLSSSAGRVKLKTTELACVIYLQSMQL